MRKIERIILKFFYCSINQKILQENVHDLDPDSDPFFLSADQGSGSASNQNQIKIKWILSTGVSYLTVLRTRAVVGETKLNKISVPWTPILLLSSSRRMLHLLHSRILNIVTWTHQYVGGGAGGSKPHPYNLHPTIDSQSRGTALTRIASWPHPYLFQQINFTFKC